MNTFFSKKFDFKKVSTILGKSLKYEKKIFFSAYNVID
jgi:hypothetical protein